MVTGRLPGMMTTDPAFGLPAVWIDASLRDQAPPWATPWSMPAPWWRPT
jgi:flagellar biosynthesis component FlhA